MSPALLLSGVTKRYADHTAVDDLSLEVPPGTIYGILGPNGAGKSSTIRMAMSIISRDAGRILVLGTDPEKDRGVLRRVGYLPEERGLYKKMTVREVIVFFARLKGMETAEARREAERWIERMGLGEWRGAKVEALSKGMQQKVQFIATVLHRPDLLILDEPTSGLDPVNQEVLRDTILEAQRDGRTVIFSTHNMDQAEQLCEHVCIIAGGRKVLDGRLREIRRQSAGNRFAIEFEAPSPQADALIRESRWFRRVERQGGGWVVEMEDYVDRRRILDALNAVDVPLVRYARIEPSLHEIFVSHVGEASTPHRHHREAVHA